MIEVILAHSRNRWLERRNSLTSSFRRIGAKVRREEPLVIQPMKTPARNWFAPAALSDQRARRKLTDFNNYHPPRRM